MRTRRVRSCVAVIAPALRLPLMVVLPAVLMAACQTPMDHPSRVGFVRVERQPPPAPAEERDYLLETGDQIEVKLYFHPELNEATFIRPDGKIALQLVGDVDAKGVTVRALGDTLQKRYTDQGLRNPLVTVLLRKAIGQRVYVGGEVGTPRMVGFEGRLTLTQALFEAGGLKGTAQLDSVLVLRDAGDGGPAYMTVSVAEDALRDGGDVMLQPYDVIFVPKSPIAKVNEFVEQYLSKIVPTWLSGQASFSYVTGSTRTKVLP